MAAGVHDENLLAASGREMALEQDAHAMPGGYPAGKSNHADAHQGRINKMPAGKKSGAAQGKSDKHSIWKVEEDDYDWNGFALSGFICSVLSILSGVVLLFFNAILAVLGIVFSLIGLLQIKHGNENGKGFAIAGIVCGVLGIMVSLYFTQLYFQIFLF